MNQGKICVNAFLRRIILKHKGLSAYSLTMLALGTVIGGSFFLGSSVAIRAAGPSILLGFIFGGALVYFILTALSEMTVADPGASSFRGFANKTYGRGAGFVTGWVYWTGMVLAMSSEAAAISILVRGWFPEVSVALLGSGVIIGVTLLNLLGADKLSRIESGLAAVKLFAVISFMIFSLLLIFGLLPDKPAILSGALTRESFLPNGFGGLAGSMLIVMFTYAGFEIIGLAASEAKNPVVTIPKAIRYTVLSLVGLYVVYIILLLPLIPTAELGENSSAIVMALSRNGMSWAGDALNIVLITAILSTMLAAIFGLGRMLRSLASDGCAPSFLKGGGNIPRNCIVATGLCMLACLGFGLLFPSVYIFLISSGGFSILFSYAVIMATHLKFRRKFGCPPNGKCQLRGYPFSTAVVLVSIVAIVFSMPFVPGQASGLIAGFSIVAFFSLCYLVIKLTNRNKNYGDIGKRRFRQRPAVSTEFSEELKPENEDKNE